MNKSKIMKKYQYQQYFHRFPDLEVQCLLEGKRLLEGAAYFNVDTQRCGAY